MSFMHTTISGKINKPHLYLEIMINDVPLKEAVDDIA